MTSRIFNAYLVIFYLNEINREYHLCVTFAFEKISLHHSETFLFLNHKIVRNEKEDYKKGLE